MENNDILSLIGNTPVVEIKDQSIPVGKKLLLKLEYFNPNFSIKDRTALGLIQFALKSGNLKKGYTIIESTSGNLGKSLAMYGAIKGYKVILVVDPKIDKAMLNIYKAYGAEIIMVEELDENGGYQKTRVAKVQSIIKENKDNKYFWPNQYENTDNMQFHYQYTGKEILDIKTECIISAVSTSGHLSGIGKRAKSAEHNPKIIGADVKGSSIFGGSFSPYLINGAGLSWTSANLFKSYIDKFIIVPDNLAISVCRYFAKNHGLLVGGSSGLSIAAAMNVLRTTQIQSVLAIVPDTGANYLTQIYDDEWVKENNVELLSCENMFKKIDDLKAKELN